MTSSWRSELWWLVGAVGLGLGAGYVTGYPLTGAGCGLLGYLGRHVYNLRSLILWIRQGESRSLPDAGGVWGYVFQRLAFMHDRDEREKEELRQSRDRYRLITKSLPEAAVTLREDGRIESINEAAVRLLGLRDPEDIGEPIVSLVRDPRFVELFRTGDTARAIEVASPANKASKLSVRVVPYGDSDKKLLLAQDVSRLHRLEQVRRDFIANISHELKSPLTVIIGYVESIQDELGDNSDGLRKPLELIEQQTHRMRGIVGDLLKLSNLETAEVNDDVETVDVPALIRSIHREAKKLSGADNHAFDLDIDDSVLLLGSFKELYSAFSNLLFNAIRYTPRDGRIGLRWYVDDSGFARYEVEDDGIGIAPQHVPRLTERFYRVDQGRSRAAGGTGLGLAIVKHVLIRHDASLDIDSTPGAGSTFRCVFPPARVLGRDRVKSVG